MKEATIHLHETVIPGFANELESFPQRGTEGEDLVLMMHHVGINCRHLGRLYEDMAMHCLWRVTAMEEMIARAFKVSIPLIVCFLLTHWHRLSYTESGETR